MDKVELWTRHFQRMAEGKLKPNYKGQYVVEKIQMGGAMKEPTINFVTSMAQAVELAKSEEARKEQHVRIENARNVHRMHRPTGLLDSINGKKIPGERDPF